MPAATDDAGIAQRYGIERSPDWDKVRAAYLLTHGACAVCGDESPLNVHHMHPFHFVVALGRPDLELDHRNFITLCTPHEEQHHILLGHLDDYESYNPHVVTFVTHYKDQSSDQIRKDPRFQQAVAQKPPHLGDLTAAQRTQLKAELDKLFPPDAKVMAEAVAARARLRKPL
jgi:hypothetical protein